MAILRAGPWGNLTDSFQNEPGDTGADGLTIYPVNCAKTDWLSGQAWGAYYEVVEGCCTPETVSITNALISSMTRGDDCSYGYYFQGYPPFYYGTQYQFLSYDVVNNHWLLYWFSATYPYEEGLALLVNGDPCDPTGTYTNSYPGPDPVVSTP